MESNKILKIGTRDIHEGSPCLIVAEVAQAHDGSLGMAHSFVDAIAKAGADAVKFQTHIAEAESTFDEPWRTKFSLQDKSRYDYWKRMEFTEEQWHGLAQHAHENELLFLSSPFSIEAVDLLTKIGVVAWKLASGEVNNIPMIEYILETKLPILLSTGISNLYEIDDIVKRIKEKNIPLVIMQCTTAYPCPPEKVGLNLIPFFKKRYNCPVGLSDHSGTIYPGLAAVTSGIAVLEVHVTLSREMFGPDVPASITMAELQQLVEGVRFIEKMQSHSIDKNIVAEEFKSMREMFTKSVVAAVDLKEGTILRSKHLTVKKPGKGILAGELQRLIGKKLLNDVKKDAFLSLEDIGDV